MLPIFTTSKFLPFTCRSEARISSSHRESGAPDMNQLEPLSATIMPYFFRAFSITLTGAGKALSSKLDFSRTRIPMGGRFALVLLLA